MLTDKRFWTLALVLSVCVLATAGCKRKRSSDNFSSDDDIFTTDTFPGADVQDGNVADDKRGFSVPQANGLTGSIKCTFNGDRCSAMVTYICSGGNFFGAGASGLFAHYYDGTTWTPPVLLQTLDSNGVGAPETGSVIHCFLNTANHASSDAQQRNGDAIILWRAQDADSDGIGLDAINTNLESAYFDVTFKDNAARRYGFQEFSTRVNSAIQTTEDVMCFGVSSDGLCGQAAWQVGGNNYRWGDDVTSVVAVWVQRENNDGIAGFEDRALHAARFDPAQILAPEFPLTPGGDTRLVINSMSASDSGTSSEETQVHEVLFTYNNNVFYKVAARNDTIFDDVPALTGWPGTTSTNSDTAIQDIAFNLSAGTFFPASDLHFTVPVSTDLIENSAEFLFPNGGFLNFDNNAGRSIYGSDEGLACIAIYFLELVADPDGDVDFGDLINDGRLGLDEVREADGVILEKGLVDSEQATISDTVVGNAVDTRISRNGDYVWAAWLEPLNSGVSFENNLWVRQYATTRILDDGTIPVPDLFANTWSGVAFVQPDVDGQPVAWFSFQDSLGYRCGVQSDPDVMNLFSEQSDGTFDEVDRTELDADIIVPGVIASFFTTIFEVGENGDYGIGGIINTAGFEFKGTDGGFNGDVYAVYREDIDGTLVDDFRLTARRDGSVAPGAAEIDSFTTFKQIPGQNFTLLTLPPGQNIGRFDVPSLSESSDRFSPAQFVHVLFFEDAVSETDGFTDTIRTRQFDAADVPSSFVDSFVPSLSAPFQKPFELAVAGSWNGGVFQDFVINTGRNGTEAVVYFFSQFHIYYQQCNSQANQVGWLTTGDDLSDGSGTPIVPASDPNLVDDSTDYLVDLNGLPIVTFNKSCSCDSIGCCIVFWAARQSGPAANNFARLQVRVHFDGGNGN